MKVAVLEDDPAQAELIKRVLASSGHNCTVFTSGRILLNKLRQETFDLLVLDWNVPDVSGLEVAEWLRAHMHPSPPFLMVTARADADDVVAGLNAGADDFLVKPVEAAVLSARVQAVLRRAYPQEQVTKAESFGGYAFDPLTLTATFSGKSVQLTSKEYFLAVLFFRNMHRALGRAYLLETVWGRNPDLPTRTLDAHVSKIRSKLHLRPENGFRLAPVYSYGYRLEHLSDDPRGGQDQ